MPKPGDIIKPDGPIDPEERFEDGVFPIPPRDLQSMVEILNQAINMYCYIKGINLPSTDRGDGYLSLTFDNGASFAFSIEQEEQATSTGEQLEPTFEVKSLT